MRASALIYALLSVLASVSAHATQSVCPDFRGTYRFAGFGPDCSRLSKNVRFSNPIPVAAPQNSSEIQPGTTFTIEQNGCDSLTVRFHDKTYLQPDRAVTISLGPQDPHELIEFSDNHVFYKKVEWDNVCMLGGCLSGRFKSEWQLSLDASGSLHATSRDSMLTAFDYLVPMVSLHKFKCVFHRAL